jgi:hypothetical protein
MRAVQKREKELRDEYLILNTRYKNEKDAWDKCRDKIIKTHSDDKITMMTELDALGPEPPPPLLPQLTFQEPTIEALVKALGAGQPSVGIFSDEGATFIGGHGLRDDARLRMGGGLSQLWDGGQVKRNRVVDGWMYLDGRRLCLHLMVQPNVAQKLLSDPELLDQGLLSRFLVCAPRSAAGERFGRRADPSTEVAIKAFEQLLLGIMRRDLPLVVGTRNELEPPAIPLSEEAESLWWAFRDFVEQGLGPDGEYHTIQSLGNKLPEHSARMAAVLAKINNPIATEVSSEEMASGIKLATYYASEALRLFEAGFTNPDLLLAQKLLDWLQRPAAPETVDLREIYRSGPNRLRDKEIAQKMVNILMDHGWLDEERRPSTDNKRETVLYHIVKDQDDGEV